MFPGVSYAVLLRTEAGRAWVFETAPAHELLQGALTEPKTSLALIKALNESPQTGVSWSKALPRGKALTRGEKDALHTLALAVTDERLRKYLFATRFDFEVTGSLSGATIERMWTVLERVPESHISDGVVKQMLAFDAPAGSMAAGEYDERTLKIRDGMLDQGGQTTGDREGDTVMMTKLETMQNLGLDEDSFKQWLADGRLTEWQGKYKLGRNKEKDVLSATLLHELGHGVHHMIGNKSEFIFDLVGWRAYSEAEFDAWAADLGGWSSVKPEDQDEIREVWMMWMSSSRGDAARESVGDMVRKDHPAVSKDYSGVGVVQLAQKKSMVNRKDPCFVGNRAAFVSHQQQRWYTIGQRGLLSAPSDYSLTAPGEYFAECYMQYYRDYDGKDPRTKGYRLAPWIKEWFDNNIDNTTRNPRAGDDFSGDE